MHSIEAVWRIHRVLGRIIAFMSIANEQTEPDDLSATVPADWAGKRLDAAVAHLFPRYSRSRLSVWLKAGYLTVNGESRAGKAKVVGGETVRLILPPDILRTTFEESLDSGEFAVVAEAVPLDLLHEDPAFFILNKSADLVMHPAPGNRHGTVMNGLLHLDPGLTAVPRAGLVHRLDKDTSGLCVVARTLTAHTHLVRQLQARSVSRIYLALVAGDPPQVGTIDEPIGRHHKDRKRMAVVGSGKRAVTHYSVIQRFPGCALLRVQLETGRTHQIRVHLTHLGYPLIGDATYQHGRSIQRLPEPVRDITHQFKRQALHAHKLGFIHPVDNTPVDYSAELPHDMQQLVTDLSALVDGTADGDFIGG